MEYTILRSIWWTPPTPADLFLLEGSGVIIGCVAIASGPDKDNWKAYIGVVSNEYNQQQAEQFIARHGMHYGNKTAACALFPMLKPGGYKS